MSRFYRFVRDVVQSDFGFSIRDVMETDWTDLLAVLKKDKPEPDVMSLEDFIGTV